MIVQLYNAVPALLAQHPTASGSGHDDTLLPTTCNCHSILPCSSVQQLRYITSRISVTLIFEQFSSHSVQNTFNHSMYWTFKVTSACDVH
jgi:hypothetical protein